MHVEDDEELGLEGDWNLLRGRTVPEEVFTIVNQGQFLKAPWEATLEDASYEIHALLRLTCHGFEAKPSTNGSGEELHWQARVVEILYDESGINLDNMMNKEVQVAQTACYSTREAAWLALRERRRLSLENFEARRRQLREVIEQTQTLLARIDEIIAAWPPLEEVNPSSLMEGRVPVPRRSEVPELKPMASTVDLRNQVRTDVSSLDEDQFCKLLEDL